MKYILGVDIGTTSTKGILYNDQLISQVKFSQHYALLRDKTGKAEQDPEQIFGAVIKVICNVSNWAKEHNMKISTVSFSSANQSLLILDQNYQPVTKIITWADTRASGVANQLRQIDLGKKIYKKTGTPIHPMSPLIKLLWLKRTHHNLLENTYISDIKSYIFYKLFGVFKVDLSVASSTGLVNLKTQNWDSDILNMLGINGSQLPKIVDITDAENNLLPKWQKLHLSNVPFVYGAFDGALANLGVGAINKKVIAITIGTSAAVRIMVDKPIIDNDQKLFCYSFDRHTWLVGGPSNNGGSVFEWAVNQFADKSYDVANKLIEQTPVGANGILLLPFLGGERAPLWNANASGSFINLTNTSTDADLLRATIEGITFNIKNIVALINELIDNPKVVMASGGFARTEAWKQILADILDIKVKIPNSYQASCLGATIVAMKSMGLISDYQEVKPLLNNYHAYNPSINARKYHRINDIFNKMNDIMCPVYTELKRLLK